ncbi:MAG: hypothetical protein WDA60_12755 [Acidimicrobiia bacterium]|jgi:hypothetical protein
MLRFRGLLAGGLLVVAFATGATATAAAAEAGTQPTATAPGQYPEAPGQCRTASDSWRRADELPLAVRGFDEGTGLIGDGALWTFPDAIRNTPIYSPLTGEWRLKLPWFRAEAGTLHVAARPVEGRARFRAEIPERGWYPDLGFMPTTLAFADGGCWRVVAQLRRSKLVFFVSVPSGDGGICASLDEQLAHRIEIPENAAFYAAADAEYARRGCGA